MGSKTRPPRCSPRRSSAARPEPGSDAASRQEPAQPLPHRYVLGLVLRELVAVNSVSDLGPAGGQGKDGNLHHLVVTREEADQAQRIGMDDIFRIVNHHDFKAEAAGCLIALHPAVCVVEAIALGGRSPVRTLGQVDAGMAPRDPADCLHGGIVVGIHAREDVVVAVTDGGQIAFEHTLDDAILLPQRHKDRDPPLRRSSSKAAGQPGAPGPACRS